MNELDMSFEKDGQELCWYS